MSACAKEVHEAMKRDPKVWASLKLVGIQRFLPGEPVMVLKNCSCGSTIGIETMEDV